KKWHAIILHARFRSTRAVPAAAGLDVYSLGGTAGCYIRMQRRSISWICKVEPHAAGDIPPIGDARGTYIPIPATGCTGVLHCLETTGLRKVSRRNSSPGARSYVVKISLL